MTKTSRNLLLWFAPIPIVVVALFATLPWLARYDDAVAGTVTSAVAVFVLIWGYYVWGRRQLRVLDEVQITGQRIAHMQGAQAGLIVTFLLLMTPLKGWVVDWLIRMTTGPGEPLDPTAVHAAITIGVSLLVAMQALGAVVAGLIWRRRVGWNLSA